MPTTVRFSIFPSNDNQTSKSISSRFESLFLVLRQNDCLPHIILPISSIPLFPDAQAPNVGLVFVLVARHVDLC